MILFLLYDYCKNTDLDKNLHDFHIYFIENLSDISVEIFSIHQDRFFFPFSLKDTKLIKLLIFAANVNSINAEIRNIFALIEDFFANF